MNSRRVIKIIERGWYFVRMPLLIFVVGVIIHTFFLTIFIVDGLSMHPTLRDRQLLVVNKISPLIIGPQRGDIVIMQFPGDPQRRIFVKRIIGIPGDKFTRNQQDEWGVMAVKDLEVPNGEYYVLGDNRQGSGDSRIWGTVPREDIIGLVFK